MKKLEKKENNSENKTKVRLNKFIANSGVCNRREADVLIKDGKISVNGSIIKELGAKVSSTDEVMFGKKRLNATKPVYILLNKPKGFTNTKSESGKYILDLINYDRSETIAPLGYISEITCGVVLLTNDEVIAKKLSSNKKLNIYHVFLDSELTKEHFDSLAKGIKIDDEIIKPAAMSYVDNADKTQVGLEINGKDGAAVQQAFKYLGYEVIKLDCVYFAGFTKKNLQRGQWRYLSEKEVGLLKKGSYK